MTDGRGCCGDRTAEIRARVDASERNGVGPWAVEVALAIGERREWREVDVSRGDLHVRWRTDDMHLLIYWMGVVVYEKCPLWSDGAGDPYTSVKSYVPGPWEKVLFALKDDVARAALVSGEFRRAQVDADLVRRWEFDGGGVADRGQAEATVTDDRPSFQEIMMDMAVRLARRSTCLRLNVGTVIASTDYRKILSMGYNGNASKLPNTCDRTGDAAIGSCGCLHSEDNAVINCDVPRSVEKLVFVSHLPCVTCAKRLINLGGVRSVYYLNDYRIKDSLLIFHLGGIPVYQYMRDGSVESRAPSAERCVGCGTATDPWGASPASCSACGGVTFEPVGGPS